MWDTLFARQVPYLGSRIVAPFLEGIPKLGLDEPGIPELDRLNGRLEPLTGWRLVSVPGLVPDEAFFAMLADKRFPIGNFIRGADSLDYLEEPDCFHDIFGHVPMLAHAPVARLMQAMGRLGVEAIAAGHGEIISRLYWHTVEFGLAREDGEVKILGAGLASSFGEAHFALEADVPRPRFTLRDAAATAYRSDALPAALFRVGFAGADGGGAGSARSGGIDKRSRGDGAGRGGYGVGDDRRPRLAVSIAPAPIRARCAMRWAVSRPG